MTRQVGQPESDSTSKTAENGGQLHKSSSNHLAPPESIPDVGNRQNKPRHSIVSRSQMKEFREAFRLFDKDGDGSITKEELGRVLQMLQEVDVDGDGNVSFEEFVDIAWSAGAGTDPDHVLSREEEEKELRDAFRVFDKHNRGYITASDLRAVLQCLGEDLSEEEIEDMIKEVDVDGDGRIDFYEFVNALGEPGNDDSYDDEDEEITIY
ncbi:EF-hand domain pair [Popillia japonica]|uniref:EF-hand domain pair n=1 Tax=Popillia japonica TaxID=7064 RepID=A0AAW1HVM2_POPJA